MKKIIFIGSGGSGKSTLAKETGRILKLPVVHLDSLYWKPNWVPTPDDPWREIVENLCAKPEWVMDGNFGGTLKTRLEACDAVVFLDLSRWVCLFRIFKRFMKYRGKSRPDMATGCHEQIDWEFLQWVWTFPSKKKPGILKSLNEINPGKKVFILKTRKNVVDFLASLKIA